MSKDIIVLTPNGRRQTVHCTPDTSILQVLEDVCKKQGYQPSDYDLKHHNHCLDLTTTLRFSNLPNKATLEMVEARKKREESNVTIGLLLDDGERRTADFSPNTSLYDLVTQLAPTELSILQQPTILYMRQEVSGVAALREKTLRQLGLIQGRAILRLLNKAEEVRQANVSAVYRRPIANLTDANSQKTDIRDNIEPINDSKPGPSNTGPDKKHGQDMFDPVKIIKNEKYTQQKSSKLTAEVENNFLDNRDNSENIDTKETIPQNLTQTSTTSTTNSNIPLAQEILERRLRIEEEVTFLGAQKAIAFMQPDEIEDEVDDLPNDFYELTLEEVRKLYKDLQQHRLDIENTPLLTTAQRNQFDKQVVDHTLNIYKNAVVRVQFPDHMILQGIFSPTNTIQDVVNFIKEHLCYPDKEFHIFTTPLKESLNAKLTLLEARFVPCVHMHFKWLKEDMKEPYLKEEIYTKTTSSDAASILASKYRAPSRRKMEAESSTSQRSNVASTSTSKNSKVPKWFKS